MATNPNAYGPPPPYTPLPEQPLPTAPSMYGATGSTTVIINPNPAETIFIVGGCPACRVGVLEEEFTCLGLLCLILFFPLGILCCLALRQRRCLNCGAVF